MDDIRGDFKSPGKECRNASKLGFYVISGKDNKALSLSIIIIMIAFVHFL